MTSPADLIAQAIPSIEYLAEHHPDCPGLDAAINIHTKSIRERTHTAILAASSYNPPAVLASIAVWVNGEVTMWYHSEWGSNVDTPSLVVDQAFDPVWSISNMLPGRTFDTYPSSTIALLTAIVDALKESESPNEN